MAKRRRKGQRWVIGGLILVCLVAVVVVGVLIWKNNQRSDTGEEETTETVEVDIEKKEGETEEEYSQRLAEEKQVKQYEGESPNKAKELSGAITHAGVVNGKLMIGVNVDQFLDAGKCELSLMRNGDVVYSESANIVADVTTSSCEEFNIPIEKTGNGKTEIIIKLSANGKEGEVRGEVDI